MYPNDTAGRMDALTLPALEVEAVQRVSECDPEAPIGAGREYLIGAGREYLTELMSVRT